MNLSSWMFDKIFSDEKLDNILESLKSIDSKILDEYVVNPKIPPQKAVTALSLSETLGDVISLIESIKSHRISK